MVVFPSTGYFFQFDKVPKTAQMYIKYDVPSEYRYFSNTDSQYSGYWYVHADYLLGVIELAYKETGVVDYSCLPPNLQIEIARAKENWTVRKPPPIPALTNEQKLRDSYAKLYLLPTAPFTVVSAVWKSLAKATHPDHGGDPEGFRKYSEAYDAIKKEYK